MESEVLFDVRNNLYLGNYQGAINEGRNARVQPGSEEALARDVLVYRAHVAQRDFDLVRDDVVDGAQGGQNAILQVVLIYADVLGELGDVSGSVPSEQVEANVQRMSALLAECEDEQSREAAIVMLTRVYVALARYDEALRCAIQSQLLEGRSLAVHCYLALNRADLADKELAQMKSIEEDAPLTQLAQAWVSLASGNADRVREAAVIFEELIDSYQSSALLLNGVAVAHLRQGRAADAEKFLLEALEKNSKDADTLANLALCDTLLKCNADAAKRNVRALRAIAPNHPWLRRLDQRASDFDTFASNYSSSK
jgi:coatomer subunit epsilon